MGGIPGTSAMLLPQGGMLQAGGMMGYNGGGGMLLPQLQPGGATFVYTQNAQTVQQAKQQQARQQYVAMQQFSGELGGQHATSQAQYAQYGTSQYYFQEPTQYEQYDALQYEQAPPNGQMQYAAAGANGASYGNGQAAYAAAPNGQQQQMAAMAPAMLPPNGQQQAQPTASAAVNVQ